MPSFYRFEYHNGGSQVVYSRDEAERLWNMFKMECVASFHHGDEIVEILGKRSEHETLPVPHSVLEIEQ